MPKQGPNDGSRKASIAFLPIWLSPKARPTLTVVLPIPAFVGLIAVTNTRWCFFICSTLMALVETLAT